MSRATRYGHRVFDRQRNAPTSGCACEWKLYIFERPPFAFRLGTTDAGSLEIHWPSGERETIKLPEVDRIYTVTEGNGFTGALCGATECEKNVRRAKAHR